MTKTIDKFNYRSFIIHVQKLNTSDEYYASVSTTDFNRVVYTTGFYSKGNTAQSEALWFVDKIVDNIITYIKPRIQFSI